MSLTVFTGPMFSGKTTAMLKEISRYTDISKDHKALVINHSLDNRNVKDVISSHSSSYKGLSDKIDVISTDKLAEVDINNYVVIGVDEACFFDDLYETVKGWLSQDKHIICSGLDGNYKMEQFGKINSLLHLADKFIKLSAICSVCLNELKTSDQVITPFNTTPAPFTKKINDNNQEIEIGGAGMYVPVCRQHHCN